ncbi:MAG: flagellar hook-basal body complex protein, partial [Planctomycetaceae bacterium]|nr:flagellar hook-basal body complex protein [Planctomycetaceae bacterium]
THTPPAPGNEQPPAEQPDEAAPSQAGEPPRTLDPGAEGYIHLPPHTGHAFLPGNGYGPPIMGEPVLSVAESSRILRSQLAPSLASLQLVERVLLNNIANASTPGFRRSRVVLTPMPAEIVRPQASEDDNGPLNPAGVLVGLGVEVAATQIDHTPGEIQTTGRRLDIAIDGEGFLSVITDGEILYTRCGNLTLDNDGCLVLAATQRRYRLEPEIQIPDTAETIRILSDGTVQTTLPGDTPPKAAGQIQLSRFLNPDGLEPQGEGVFAMTRAAGRPQTGNPGTGGRGTLRAGALEQSNVRIEQEQQRIEQIRQQAQLIRSLLGNEGYRPEGPSGVVERTPEPPRVASQPEGYRPYAPMWNPSTSGRTAPGRTAPRNMPLAIPPSYRMPTGNLPYYDPTLQLAPPTGPELPAAPAYDTFNEPQSPAGSPQPQELPLPPDPEEQPIDDSPVTLPLPASLPRILDQPADKR